ncbi:hypothetical protein ABEG17_04920 [Pedococcus sp. KACC 23699]|uniref:Lipoprotein n=1 Tax=Pedococcus sp. KACC 23699 TaxID=3149228 RepID=A0AAU7JWB0_9MICO
MGTTGRRAVLGPLAAAVILTGCTGPGSPTPASTGGGSPSAASTPGASTPGSSRSGSSTPAQGRAGATASPVAPRAVTDPRAAMPVISPNPVGQIGYGTASVGDRRHFVAVTGASAGMITSSAVRTVTVNGTDVGAVAVYRIKRGAAASTTFQDQYAVQLLGAVARSKPRFVRTRSGVMALSTGKASVAAWFKDDQLTLVYRDAGTPELAALAQGVRSAPPPV